MSKMYYNDEMPVMKRYRDLNLAAIRDKNDLDFAHFTFKKNQCSCCFGPEDQAKRYWKNHEIKSGNYKYILFKNADNGSGHVTKDDFIVDYTCIEHNLEDNMQRLAVCLDLQRQLGPAYRVVNPNDVSTCIIIRLENRLLKEEKEQAQKIINTEGA